MLICRNAEGLHGKLKVGNPCCRLMPDNNNLVRQDKVRTVQSSLVRDTEKLDFL